MFCLCIEVGLCISRLALCLFGVDFALFLVFVILQACAALDLVVSGLDTSCLSSRFDDLWVVVWVWQLVMCVC